MIMTLFELINFCNSNNFINFKEKIAEFENESEEERSKKYAEEELEALNMNVQAVKDLQFLYLKHYDSFEISIYKHNLEPETTMTVQVLLITPSGNTIPQGFNFDKKGLEELTREELTDLLGKMIFRILADYGKLVAVKLLQVRGKSTPPDISKMN